MDIAQDISWGGRVVAFLHRHAGNAPIVVLTPLTWAAIRFRGLLPGTTTRLMGLVNRVLPGPAGEPGAETRGAEARRRLGSPIVEALTVLGRRAARRNNER